MDHRNFNSHAHVERDNEPYKIMVKDYHFNSHAHVERDPFNVALKNSATHFNSHAHVERDETTSFYEGENKNFNSHAHVERDYLKIVTYTWKNISTHTLTWSVTRILRQQGSNWKFQLTRSRGA